METSKTYENYYRRKAERLHMRLEKTRVRYWSIDNHLGWRIVDPDHNKIIAGEKFGLTIQEAASFLDEYENKMKEGSD
jgi:hypothetical protein